MAAEGKGSTHAAFLHKTIWKQRTETKLFGERSVSGKVPIHDGNEGLGWPGSRIGARY